jgi:Spy/CpxP family protein refolding chaperone
MKKLIAFTLILVGFGFASQAQQDPSTKQESKKESKKKIKDELNLTKEQSKELKTINKDFKDKAGSIKANQALSTEQRKEQLAKLHKEKMDKMNTILTPEQQQKMKELKKTGHHSKGRKSAETTK